MSETCHSVRPNRRWAATLATLALATGVLAAGCNKTPEPPDEPAPVVEKEPYVVMPDVMAAPVATEIDPRAEVGEEYDETDRG